MRHFILGFSILLLVLGYDNCAKNVSSPWNYYGPSLTPSLAVSAADAYAVQTSVGCSGGYVNEPCVTVTVCYPGNTQQCATIPNVLIDTGSYGLRLFKSTIGNLNLPQVKDGSGNPLAECVSYADSSSDWGPIVKADFTVGGMQVSGLSIQQIDSGFAKVPSGCTGLDSSPAQAGFNGILGIGVLKYDCEGCHSAGNNIYFTCSSGSSSCPSLGVADAYKVHNPIFDFPAGYNNGVILQYPGIVSTGAPPIPGYMIFGIGTQADNTPGSTVQVFATDPSGLFTTNYNGQSLPGSFIDSGSNGYFFPGNSTTFPKCSASTGFYCPNSVQDFSAIQMGYLSGVQQSVAVEVVNADVWVGNADSSVRAFNNIGGPMPGVFDWGFPFFLGRTVYVGFEGATSTLGTGPYWAF